MPARHHRHCQLSPTGMLSSMPGPWLRAWGRNQRLLKTLLLCAFKRATPATGCSRVF